MILGLLGGMFNRPITPPPILRMTDPTKKLYSTVAGKTYKKKRMGTTRKGRAVTPSLGAFRTGVRGTDRPIGERRIVRGAYGRTSGSTYTQGGLPAAHKRKQKGARVSSEFEKFKYGTRTMAPFAQTIRNRLFRSKGPRKSRARKTGRSTLGLTSL